MNHNTPAGRCLSGNTAKALFFLKIAYSVLILIPLIVILTSGKSFLDQLKDFQLLRYAGAMTYGILLLLLLPFFTLIGTAVTWAITLKMSRSRENNGMLMRFASVASLALSTVGFAVSAGFCLTLLMIRKIDARFDLLSLFSQVDRGIFLAVMLFTAAGTIAVLPTAILRVLFYRDLQLSYDAPSPQLNRAVPYAAIKCIDAVVAAGFGVIVLLLMSNAAQINDVLSPKTNIVYVFSAFAFFAIAAADILEAMLVFRCKKCGDAPVETAEPAKEQETD